MKLTKEQFMTIKLKLMLSAEVLAEQLGLPVQVVQDVRAGKYILDAEETKEHGPIPIGAWDFRQFGYHLNKNVPAEQSQSGT